MNISNIIGRILSSTPRTRPAASDEHPSAAYKSLKQGQLEQEVPDFGTSPKEFLSQLMKIKNQAIEMGEGKSYAIVEKYTLNIIKSEEKGDFAGMLKNVKKAFHHAEKLSNLIENPLPDWRSTIQDLKSNQLQRNLEDCGLI